MLFRQRGVTHTQLFVLVILFFTRGDFGGNVMNGQAHAYF